MSINFDSKKRIEDLFCRIGVNITYLSTSITFTPDEIHYIKELFRVVQKSVGIKETVQIAINLIDYVLCLVFDLGIRSVDYFSIKCLKNIILRLTSYINLVKGN
jgi:hypothetical protein